MSFQFKLHFFLSLLVLYIYRDIELEASSSLFYVVV